MKNMSRKAFLAVFASTIVGTTLTMVGCAGSSRGRRNTDDRGNKKTDDRGKEKTNDDGR